MEQDDAPLLHPGGDPLTDGGGIVVLPIKAVTIRNSCKPSIYKAFSGLPPPHNALCVEAHLVVLDKQNGATITKNMGRKEPFFSYLSNIFYS